MQDQLMTINGNANNDWIRARDAIDTHTRRSKPRYDKLWAYYRNPIELVRASGNTHAQSTRGWYRAAQEAGLPDRIVGAGNHPDERGRREVVIENDIAWRIATMVDFMFGSPIRVQSLARDKETRRQIEQTLERIWEASGGIATLQDTATLGHVFGHVDLLVRVDEQNLPAMRPADAHHAITIEPIDARRGVAVLNQHDYRTIELYALHVPGANDHHTHAAPRDTARRGWLDRLRSERHERNTRAKRDASDTSEVFTPDARFLVRADEVVEHTRRTLLPGTIPVVHIQNMSQPFVYEGLGEVEPLLGLQDELNTRLSDRASRVTMQSFKMYLAKGIDGFRGTSVAPGMVWSTDNPEASISSFGGDAASPSEEAHITEIREAMDKVSAVPPLAGGVVRAKIGNLSSANALRITLMSLIAKTMRKRVTYGRGIEQASTRALQYLNAAGVLTTDPDDRAVRVVWGPLPVVDELAVIEAGREKINIGVEPQRVLDDLGYTQRDPGII